MVFVYQTVTTSEGKGVYLWIVSLKRFFFFEIGFFRLLTDRFRDFPTSLGDVESAETVLT